MAVAEVKLASTGRAGTDDVTGVRTYTTVYLVRTDSAYDTKSIVTSHPSIPQYGQFYQTSTETDATAFLQSRSAQQLSAESNLLWAVTCVHSTTAFNNVNGMLPIVDPFGAEAVVEWDFHEDKEAAYFAYDNQDKPVPISNSAGDVYDPPLERDFSRLILRVEKNFASYDPLLASQYANTVNSDNWLGFPKWTILCKPFKGKLTIDHGVTYWRVTFEFHFDFRRWTSKVWDTGLREFITQQDIDNKRVSPDIKKPGYNHIKNADGTFITEPILLNGAGYRLIPPGGVLSPALAMDGIIYNQFRLYRQMPFIPLGVL